MELWIEIRLTLVTVVQLNQLTMKHRVMLFGATAKGGKAKSKKKKAGKKKKTAAGKAKKGGKRKKK